MCDFQNIFEMTYDFLSLIQPCIVDIPFGYRLPDPASFKYIISIVLENYLHSQTHDTTPIITEELVCS